MTPPVPDSLLIPREAIPLLLLQRIELQKVGSAVDRNPLGSMLYRSYEKSRIAKKLYRFYTFHLEPWIRRRQITQAYSASMAAEFKVLRAHLPTAPQTVVDIGCGIGGIDVLLYHHFTAAGTTPHFFMVDKSELSPEIVFGFHETAASYNSLGLTARVMAENGVAPANVHPVDAADFNSVHIPPADLVLSLYAWGFHFPIRTYIERVSDLMRADAHLILDVRDGTEGQDVIAAQFGGYEVVAKYPRHTRLLARK